MTSKTTFLMAVAASLSLATNAMAQSEEAVPPPPPEPGETQLQPAIPPQQPSQVQANEQANLCPPVTRLGRVTHDRAPGRSAQVGGGMMIGLGLVSLGVGAGFAAWGAERNDTTVTGIAAGFAGAGGFSFLAGIPIAAAGTHWARRARVDHADLSFGPVPGGGAGRVSLSF